MQHTRYDTCDASTVPPGSTRADRIRRRLAIGAIAATLPYSVLKIAWLSGSRVGLSGSTFGTSGVMHAGNALTLALDLVALLLAITVFSAARAPRWFLLPTMWIGYGLLGQIVVTIGPSVAVQLLTGPPADTSTSTPIAGWVYAVVYAGFSGLGLCLLPAFGIYAWQRWGEENRWGERLSGIRREVPVIPTLGVAAVTVALAVRAVRSGSGAEATSWTSDALIGGIAALVLLGVALGRPARMRRAVALALVWTASGAWAAWGCFSLVLSTVPNDLVTDPVSAADVTLYVAKIIAGAALLLAVRALAARRPGH